MLRGSSRPLSQTGAVDRATCSCATYSCGHARSCSTRRCFSGSVQFRSEYRFHAARRERRFHDHVSRGGPIPSSAHTPVRTTTLRLMVTSDALPVHVSPDQVEKASWQRSLIRPLPSALATLTFPARTALTRPGTPRNESPRNSSGSQKLSSTRRRITSTCRKPSTVFR